MMRSLKQLGCIVIAATISFSPAFALENSDREEIATAFDKLIADIETGNHAGFLDVMPPKIIDKMAEQAGIDTETFKSAIIQQVEGVMAEIDIEEASYDLEGATTGTSEIGRDYAVIPTRTVMETGDQRVEALGPALALEDEGQWYIVRIESPQHSKVVAEAYPDLADVELPAGTMTPVELSKQRDGAWPGS